MNERYIENIGKSIPSIDIQDYGTRRQFAPECSQTAYSLIFNKEYAIGDYI